MIQVKNVQAKSRVKSKKRKKCRKFSGKIGGKFPEIFRKISNFSAEIFRLTSLAGPFCNVNQDQTDTSFLTDTRDRYFYTASMPIPMPIPIPRGTVVWCDSCSQVFLIMKAFIYRQCKCAAQRNCQNSHIQHCKLKLLTSKIVLNQQSSVTVMIASKAEQACKIQVVQSIGIGPLFSPIPILGRYHGIGRFPIPDTGIGLTLLLHAA